MKLLNFSSFSSPTKLIREGWPKFIKIPGGKRLFSTLVGNFIPYTGSISPLVTSIEDHKASVFLKDRRAVRNHLDSIHAIALANLGEFTTGLCVISQLQEKSKAILVKIEIEYLKKARGDLLSTAEQIIEKSITEDTDFKVKAEIKNLQDEIVCVLHATWRVRP